MSQAHRHAAEQSRRTDDEHQLVLFQLSDEDYGVDIYSVQRLIQVPEVTRVPQAPEYVEGVIDVRGDIIPVINLKKRFGFDTTDVSGDGRIVITETGEHIVGFLVDAVSEVTRLSNEDIEPPAPVVVGDRADYVAGIGKQSVSGSNTSRLIIVLDVAKVLAAEEVRCLGNIGGRPGEDGAGRQTDPGDLPAAGSREEVA